MRYLGLDVHCGATVWCLLDDAGEVVERGKLPTTQAALTELVRRLSEDDELLAGQEVGTMSYFVHDVLTAAGVKLLSFNAHQLRMIASSRKKTDKRDAFWIAKALQTGMTPHPVYVPSGQVRLLRQLLSERDALRCDQKRWLIRAKSSVRAAGLSVPASRTVESLLSALIAEPAGIDETLAQTLERYGRMHALVSQELSELEAAIERRRGSDRIRTWLAGAPVAAAKPLDRLVGPAFRTATCAGATSARARMGGWRPLACASERQPLPHYAARAPPCYGRLAH